MLATNQFNVHTVVEDFDNGVMIVTQVPITNPPPSLEIERCIEFSYEIAFCADYQTAEQTLVFEVTRNARGVPTSFKYLRSESTGTGTTVI